MFWKRDEEARSRGEKAQREWTTGLPAAKTPGSPAAKATGSPVAKTPGPPVAKTPGPPTAKTPAATAAKDAGAKLANAPAPVTNAPEPVDVSVTTPVLRPALGPDTSVSGRLSFTMPTRIDGKLRGEVHATDLLLIGEQGYVEGVVRAPILVVLGEVRGEVRGAERVEIKVGGRVMGSIETTSLVVEEGGCLDGDCHVAPPRSTVHVLRPAQASNDG